MNRWSCAGLLMPICLIGQFPATSHAQNYPAKPVRYIIPSSGSTEVVARLVAQGMEKVLGQRVIVDPRVGAAGNLGAEIASRAAPDGYTVFQATQSHTFNASYYKSLPYDLQRDFVAVTRTDLSPMIVVVHPSLPVKSIRELVNLAKAKPGDLTYSTAGVGTSAFLASELFKVMSGINMLEVPYRGGAQALTAVIAGEVSIIFAPIPTALPHVREGRLRPIAVSTTQRLPAFPDYPTVTESGYPGYEASNWHGLMMPANTPQEFIKAIHAAVVAGINQPEISSRMRNLGYIVIGDRPEEFAAFIKADIEKWRKIVLQRGLSAK